LTHGAADVCFSFEKIFGTSAGSVSMMRFKLHGNPLIEAILDEALSIREARSKGYG
jgi:hypothetical protein